MDVIFGLQNLQFPRTEPPYGDETSNFCAWRLRMVTKPPRAVIGASVQRRNLQFLRVVPPCGDEIAARRDWRLRTATRPPRAVIGPKRRERTLQRAELRIAVDLDILYLLRFRGNRERTYPRRRP